MTKRDVAKPAPPKPGQVVTVDLGGKADPRLRAVGGADSDVLNNALINRVVQTAWIPAQWSDEDQANLRAAAVLALAALKPRDAVEGMMAAQAVGLHHTALECMRRAMLAEQPPDVAARLRKDAANLSRAMVDMLEAIDRKRGKGLQVLRIERVTVEAGGQAIVGNLASGVRPGAEGGGA